MTPEPKVPNPSQLRDMARPVGVTPTAPALPSVPEGYALVPIKPTPEMVDVMLTWGTKRSEWEMILRAAALGVPPSGVAGRPIPDLTPEQRAFHEGTGKGFSVEDASGVMASACVWPTRPLKLVQVTLPDGTSAALPPERAYFDAWSVQELENKMKATPGVDAVEAPSSLRDRIAPLLNAFGELHWKSGRGHDVPHEQIEDAFEAIIAAADGVDSVDGGKTR